jgi:hypothetical protein
VLVSIVACPQTGLTQLPEPVVSNAATPCEIEFADLAMSKGPQSSYIQGGMADQRLDNGVDEILWEPRWKFAFHIGERSTDRVKTQIFQGFG